jgi:tetratricopeptide (TPR) repeat protein
LLRSGDARAAVPYVLAAGETEAAMGAFADALALVGPVVSHARGRERARLLALRADLLAAVGDPSAVPAYRTAIDEAAPDEIPVMRAHLARAAVQRGDLATAQEAVRDLETDGGAHDGTILMARGMVAYAVGDLDSADTAADQARERVGQGARSWQLLDVVALQGLLAHNRGEWFERLRHELLATRGAPELAVSVFDSHLCVAEYLLYGPTPYDEVLRMARELRESAQRSGALRAVAFASAVIGEAALLSGDLETAERELVDGIGAHREIGAHAGEALCLQRLAELRLAEGNRELAVSLLRQSLARARWSMLAPHLIQRIYGTWIRAAADPEAARAVVDQADATLSDADECQFCQVMYLLPSAIACADVGDLDDARRRLLAGEQCAARWPGTAWQAAVLEARSHVARAEAAEAEADRLLAEAAAVFEAAGQPLDAARCRA